MANSLAEEEETEMIGREISRRRNLDSKENKKERDGEAQDEPARQPPARHKLVHTQ